MTTKKRQRQLAKERERRHVKRLLPVRCDECGIIQQFSRGNGSRHAVDREPDVSGCIHCGHHYGTYV